MRCTSLKLEISIRVKLPLPKYHAPSTHVGMNGLHMAIYHGHRAVIDALSDKGVDLAKATLRGETPLHIAARCGHVDLIRLLIEKGANPNAISFAQVDRMEQIVPMKTDRCYVHSSALGFRDARSGRGIALDEDAESPTHYVVLTGRKKCIKELLGLGRGNVNVSLLGTTPLHKALEGGHQEVIETLIEAGADVNIPLLYGRTPLHFCRCDGSRARCSVLTSERC
jgi:ankyrin repeat protein